MNYSDSERLKSVLEHLGYTEAQDPKKADLIIMNSCSVRQHAEDRIFGFALQYDLMHQKNKNFKVGLTGCMVRKTSTRKQEKNGEKVDKLLKRIASIDFTVRIEEIAKLPEILGIKSAKISKENEKIAPQELQNYFHIDPKHTSKAQAFIPISTGCDKFCSYCIVPYARGREHSRPMKDILAEVKNLVEKGYKEVTLVGQTVNSYGLSVADKKTKEFASKIASVPLSKLPTSPFTRLLQEVDKFHAKGLKRVRFTSPYPLDVADDFIDAMGKLKTVMPYIHLPIQSGDNETLKRMNRKYTAEHYTDIIKRIRKRVPNCSITTDIIVGFCGETEKQFMNTYKLFKKIKWEMCYIAKYSPRPGTVSEKLLKDDVLAKEKARRFHKLNDLLREIAFARNKTFVGKTVGVLVESFKKGLNTGKSEHFKIVQFKSKKSMVGQIVPIKITKAYEWILEGKAVGRI
ncbi:MAG: MiaB family RNA modification protein, bifunctional enzyme involved in thiolation and methylation of tRNA [Candidatus Peregrinibacteria bacterium GW2011_GWC2_39_14]|nr:MAG: (Dimethylallyl)adenosine tRNA methylthiotransferase MiaB [Candidatus Peregrinibacteria bacterium GW2011_GWA2_38_36]KKR05223.1 MAG: MiaB family RNA modification protein, bifunctional enzyme involved in thiolation and methylation of tRNA [Candidatus Peregrinibacteria bacterium GW2011_GWC2_39_14]